MVKALKATGWIAILLLAGLELLYVVMLPPDISYSELEGRYDQSESQYLDLHNGLRIHFQDVGAPSAPTLLLIHGFGVSLQTWQAWETRLHDRYRLVTIDLPGHGLTRSTNTEFTVSTLARIVADIIRAQQLTDVILVGNSLGGAVAWNVALRAPEHLAGLVLIDASGWEWTDNTTTPTALINILSGPFLRKIDKSSIFRELLATAYYDPTYLKSENLHRYVEFTRAPEHRAILDKLMVNIMTGKDSDIKATDEKLATILLPTLILWGAEDQMVNSKHAQYFGRAIANSTVVIYPRLELGALNE